MNAIPAPYPDVALDDKYTSEEGRIFVSGIQALVRLPMMQRKRDAAEGLDTAGFISGYRGSPLGGLDVNLWRAQAFLARHHVRFQPGVNEDLAATAVWGSQQSVLFPDAKYDGVVGIWYGKGPGVDRSGDALKHGSLAGSARHGGVICLAGDDHGCKSSTLPHQSEQAFVHYMIPVLNPATVSDYLAVGLRAIAMSRFSGCWIAMKTISESVETSSSVLLEPIGERILLPDDFELPPGGLNIRSNDDRFDQERRHIDERLPAAQAFARANGLDAIVLDSPRPRLGIAAPGKAYLDVREALELLGIDEIRASSLGLRVYKITLSWPLEPVRAAEFANGLEEILVVEEKRGFVEEQLKTVLFNGERSVRRIVGKHDEHGRSLLPSHYVIQPTVVARAILSRLRRFTDVSELEPRLAEAEALERRAESGAPSLSRAAFFCSGCPHNTSTRVPEGSQALAGIGCHAMAKSIPDRNTVLITHMGAEGANWVGRAPFTSQSHVFQNLGDGTYFHSGLLAIRQAVASGANITYKILFNDAVAMTGGQPVDGPLTVDRVAQQVAAEGVKRVVVVTDEPEKYGSWMEWPRGTRVHHRDDLDAVQRELREVSGCTVLIYDQTCAAEKRRRRKRGTFPDPDRRAFINDLVCEGCGDCSRTSNCISIQPLETELGRKRRVDQSNCNKDFSCLKGFCPSFVTVQGGALRKAERADAGGGGDEVRGRVADLPEPALPQTNHPYGILVTGIGGTGVVTIGALLGMAAHLEGRAVTVMDDTGMAQKNGAVASHIRIGATEGTIHASRLPTGAADLLLGCDIVEAASATSLARCSGERTRAVVNSKVVPPAAFVLDWNVDLDDHRLMKRIRRAVVPDASDFVDATGLASALIGNSIAANPFLMGYAWQKGLIPLERASLARAIELNGVAVAANLQAFDWGRLAAHDPESAREVAAPLLADESRDEQAGTLEAVVERRVAYLAAYQDERYAARYRTRVDAVSRAEANALPGNARLARTVAENYFKLLAYKDEYEVARLYTSGEFEEKLRRQFEGEFSLRFHLAPPLFARRDPETGHLKKGEYGPWVLKVMRVLAELRFLRGTFFDVFGWTAERRRERALIAEYEAVLDEIVPGLSAQTHDLAVSLAELPKSIKGFGHVKAEALEEVKRREAELLELWRSVPSEVGA